MYGTGWTEELKHQTADNVINKLAEYAPNIKDSIIARRVESPAELGERLGSYKGNYYQFGHDPGSNDFPSSFARNS